MAVLPIGMSGEAGGYQIQRSLRFNSADSAYLDRTPGSAGNRRTFTWAAWVKRSAFGASSSLFSANTNSLTTGYVGVYFGGSDDLTIQIRESGTNKLNTTTQVFRDPSAWYHIVLAIDTTQATGTNRCKLYINGTQVTAFSTQNEITQNFETSVNDTVSSDIGTVRNSSGTRIAYFNGYMAEINFIDGQALTPYSFGYTNPTTGVWSPLEFVGTYGTNGFYLNFSDNSNTTSTTLGKDYSGNGNNWTPNNFSVTAGAGNDSLVDTPTPYGTDTGAGGEVRGNYATLNPLQNALTLANGNLDNTQSGGGAYAMAKSTFGLSTGKWYWEVLITARPILFDSRFSVGISSPAETTGSYVGSTSGGYGIFGSTSVAADGSKVNNGSFTSVTGAGFTTNDVLMFAFDADAGKLWFGKNGTWLESGAPASGTNAQFTSIPAGIYLPAISSYSGTGYTSSASNNFGQRPFAYAAPSGFKALCTQNLPTPTVVQGDDYFNTVLYTGTGAAGNAVTGVGFQPDLVWIKCRNTAINSFNILRDVVRGSTKRLISDLTNDEVTDSNYGTFDTDGFTVGNQVNVNTNNNTYVAWNWKANGSGVSNTDGTITSTVSANTTSGFSIVTYTGTSANATVGHGLGVAPAMIIVKVRNTTDGWFVYNKEIGNTKYLRLNTTDAAATFNLWQNTNPTSTVFSLATDPTVNGSGNTYVAYCFAEVAGYSRFGSYTGNGSADGVFVYTGHRPAYVMIKRSTSDPGGGGNWVIKDSKRLGYNATDRNLFANLSNAETTEYAIDFLSNGFKIRASDTDVNASSQTYIFASFAEVPTKFALAR